MLRLVFKQETLTPSVHLYSASCGVIAPRKYKRMYRPKSTLIILSGLQLYPNSQCVATAKRIPYQLQQSVKAHLINKHYHAPVASVATDSDQFAYKTGHNSTLAVIKCQRTWLRWLDEGSNICYNIFVRF